MSAGRDATPDDSGAGVPATPPATTVFLSYSRADEKRARPIIEALERAGYAVWWDGLLGGGDRFARATAEALERARAVVVLWSKTSIDSHWVHDEATAGRDASRLVPLSLDGSMAPLGFRQFQVIDVSHARRDGPEIRQLLEAVAALHDAPPMHRTARAATSDETPLVRRRGLILGGAALVAVGAAAAVAWRTGLVGGPAAPANTVAVLPFANLSGDAGQRYFADGLAAEIRSTLARNAALRVMGQTSSNAFRTRTEDAKSIARLLGVAFLLDGNVRLAPGRVRVDAELIDGRTGFSRWAQTFDRTLDDIFTVQSEIAGAVTAALTRAVARPAAALHTGATANVAAFDAYLRGKAAYALAAGPDTDREALAHFDEAIAADPRFAAAHAGRGRTLAALANEQGQKAADRGTTYDEAIEAARRAVALGPDLADAHSALGFILVGRLDVRGARAPYERSYQLGQGDADVLSRYGLYCGQTGRFEAAETALQHARELDPLNPRAFYNSGYIEFASHRFAEALPLFQKALELNPKMSAAHGYVGYSLLLLGRADEAEAAFRLELKPDPLSKRGDPLTSLPGLAMVAKRAGHSAEAEARFADLVRESGDNGLYQQAQVLAQWGDVERALDTLQRARKAGDPGLFLAGQDPLLDPLRKDPRFSRLLGELGFV
jgi:TolB-like protein/tetratricopeptide (TPR) repeat protein